MSFVINLPVGSLSVLMNLKHVIDRIPMQVVTGEYVQTPMLDTYEGYFVAKDPRPKMGEAQYHKLEQMIKTPSRVLHMHDRRDEAVAYLIDKLKEAVSKKPVEFHTEDLTLKSVEELSLKYMENWGSESGCIVIFKLSNYHKFAAIIDDSAFQVFINDHGTHGKLVELRPDRWVLGRYESDMKLLHEMESMRRYVVDGVEVKGYTQNREEES